MADLVEKRFKVGVQLHPFHCSVQDLQVAWRRAEEVGVDTIWIGDHILPVYGDVDGPCHEAWSLLAAMAVDTTDTDLGVLVSCVSFRNPRVLAHIAATCQALSDGRLTLGLGAGWFEPEYKILNLPFETALRRLRYLEGTLPEIRDALRDRTGDTLPILIGGGGEKVTLRIVAEMADAWNWGDTPEGWARKNAILDQWCARTGRPPEEVERTASLVNPDALNPDEIYRIVEPLDADFVEAYVNAGASQVIVGLGPPFDLRPVEAVVGQAKG